MEVWGKVMEELWKNAAPDFREEFRGKVCGSFMEVCRQKIMEV